MSLAINPGDLIDGKYVVERLLGQGGMGAVYVAREERLGRRVAIKLLLPSVTTNPEAVARFEREARAAAGLQSDHVTRVYGVGHMEGGAPYIAMELLDGEDLAASLERRGPLPIAEVVSVMVQACDALAEAHALGIVHRDLKPANIFLARRPNGTTTVKVLDFGISKTRVNASGDPVLTSTSALMGTPHYMSPEQIREARNVDGRADIWALGVTIYELLTGVRPFHGEGLADICVMVLTADPLPLTAHRPEIPPALAATIARCLRRDPQERFATTTELVHALQSTFAPTPAAFAPTHASSGPPPRMESSNAPREGRIPTAVMAATVDPVSNTQTWLEPRRPGPVLLVVGGAVVALVAALGVFTFVSNKKQHANIDAHADVLDVDAAAALVSPPVPSVVSSAAAPDAGKKAVPAVLPTVAPVHPTPSPIPAAIVSTPRPPPSAVPQPPPSAVPPTMPTPPPRPPPSVTPTQAPVIVNPNAPPPIPAGRR